MATPVLPTITAPTYTSVVRVTGADAAARGVDLLAKYAAAKAAGASSTSRHLILLPSSQITLVSPLNLDTNGIDISAETPYYNTASIPTEEWFQSLFAVGDSLITTTEASNTDGTSTGATAVYKPHACVVDSTFTGTGRFDQSTFIQTARDVRLTGFTIANLAGPFSANALLTMADPAGKLRCGLLINGDNSLSVYDRMYFYRRVPLHGGTTLVPVYNQYADSAGSYPVFSLTDFSGIWIDCTGCVNSWRWAAEKWFNGTMQNCTAMAYSFGGDDYAGGIGEDALFVDCEVVGSMSDMYTTPIPFNGVGESGWGGFCGCRLISRDIKGKFYNCKSGTNSFAAGGSIYDTAFFYKCSARGNSFVHHTIPDIPTNINSGTFIRCSSIVGDGETSECAFGFGVQETKSLAKMYECTITGIEGASAAEFRMNTESCTLVNCTFTIGGTGDRNGFYLLDDNSIIVDTTITPTGTGDAVVNNGSDRSFFGKRNTLTGGLGASVTQNGTFDEPQFSWELGLTGGGLGGRIWAPGTWADGTFAN